jgi:hypothetical protein
MTPAAEPIGFVGVGSRIAWCVGAINPHRLDRHDVL